jgi:hypothetical protein
MLKIGSFSFGKALSRPPGGLILALKLDFQV